LELRDYCQRRQWSSVAEYADVISGAKFTRSGLDKLMAEIRRGKLDLVICFKLDRLGRSLAHLAQICSELTTIKILVPKPSLAMVDDMPALSIRHATVEDAGAIAALSAQLGYNATAISIRERLTRILSKDESCVFVAEDNGEIIGWIHAAIVQLVESVLRAEIGGLVVDERILFPQRPSRA
jgi:hypothetical protein